MCQGRRFRVLGSHSRPHYFERCGPEVGVYVRVGSTNRRADTQMILELRRFARGEALDEQAMPDLDTLRLVTAHQGGKVPVVGGVVLFGRDRSYLIPDAWIQAGRFAGTDKIRIADQLEIRFYPVEAIINAVVHAD